MVSVNKLNLFPFKLENHLYHVMGGVHVDGACFDRECAGGFSVRVEQSRMSKTVSCSHRLHPGKEMGKSQEICSVQRYNKSCGIKTKTVQNINNVDFHFF